MFTVFNKYLDFTTPEVLENSDFYKLCSQNLCFT